MLRTPRWLIIAVVSVAVANFVVFLAVAMAIGGDAINGHESAGRYFLSYKGHLTEVSQSVFLYSKIHFISVAITHITAMAAWILYYLGGSPDR